MAHKKAQGSTNNGRDSNAKRLGVKIFGGLEARTGNIIIRQKGNKFWPGEGVSQGKDFTLYANQDGVVSFTEKRKVRYDGRVYRDIYVSVK
ncbi:MAG: 50S ribosomal protein L27 [Candidatus Altimarinota bacterium]